MLDAYVDGHGRVVHEANDLRFFCKIHFGSANDWLVVWPDGTYTSS